MAVIDALGTVYAGLDEPSVRHIRDFALGEAGPGGASLVGLGRQVSPAAAALCNASAAHALDFDNISLVVSGFVATPALFALLAVGETLGRPVGGREVLQAFVAGWEVEAESFIDQAVMERPRAAVFRFALEDFGGPARRAPPPPASTRLLFAPLLC